MEASARMDELRAKLAKPKPATPDKWEPDDHPHAIWCSYYGPDDAMQSTNTLSYIAPAAQENRFDLTLAGRTLAKSASGEWRGEEAPLLVRSRAESGEGHVCFDVELAPYSAAMLVVSKR